MVNKGNEILFTESLTSSADESRTNLGDCQQVEALLRTVAHDAMGKFNELPSEDFAEEVRRMGVDRLKVFVKPDDTVFPVRGWNKPGGIDRHLATWLGIDESNALALMGGVLVNLISELIDIEDYALQPDTISEQWQFQVDGVFHRYALLMVGYTLPMIATQEES